MCLQLGYRFAHVLRRMLPIALHLLQKEGGSLTGHDLFLKRVGASFHNFVEEVETATRNRCAPEFEMPPACLVLCHLPSQGAFCHALEVVAAATRVTSVHACSGQWQWLPRLFCYLRICC